MFLLSPCDPSDHVYWSGLSGKIPVAGQADRNIEVLLKVGGGVSPYSNLDMTGLTIWSSH